MHLENVSTAGRARVLSYGYNPVVLGSGLQTDGDARIADESLDSFAGYIFSQLNT